MSMPGFTAEVSLYHTSEGYNMAMISTVMINTVSPASCSWWQWILDPLGCAVGYDFYNAIASGNQIDCDWDQGRCIPRKSSGLTASPPGVTIGPPTGHR
jgi:hypothetical protein